VTSATQRRRTKERKSTKTTHKVEGYFQEGTAKDIRQVPSTEVTQDNNLQAIKKKNIRKRLRKWDNYKIGRSKGRGDHKISSAC